MKRKEAMSSKTAANIALALESIGQDAGDELGTSSFLRRGTSSFLQMHATAAAAVTLNTAIAGVGGADVEDGRGGAGAGGAADRGEAETSANAAAVLEGPKVRGRGAWMNVKNLIAGTSGFLKKKSAPVAVAEDEEDDADEGSQNEDDDHVGELETRPNTRDGKFSRPATRSSGRSRHSAVSDGVDSKTSMAVSFSMYHDNVSEVPSHRSLKVEEEEDESEANGSPRSKESGSPDSPKAPCKKVEPIYVDDIYTDAFLAKERPSTSEHRRWSEHEHLPHRVLFCLTDQGCVRRWAIKMNRDRYVKAFVELVVVVNLLLVASGPVGWGHLDASLQAKRVFFDFVTAVLISELLLKIATFGLLMTPVAVLRSPVCVMELVIVMIALSDGGLNGRAGNHVLGCCAKSFRILWLLRLVAEGDWKSLGWLKCMVQGIHHAVLPLFWCLTLLLLATWVFGIVGMRIAGGKLASCSDTITLLYPQGRLECANTYLTSTGLLFPRAWHDAPLTFNDLPQSLVTLAVVSSMQWSDMLEDLMDATPQVLQPLRLYCPEMALFLACFMVLVCFMLGNLTIAYVANAIRDSQSPEKKRTRRYILFKNRILQWAPHVVPDQSVWKGAELASVIISTPGFRALVESLNLCAIGYVVSLPLAFL